MAVLFVGGLSYDAEERDLKDIFAKHDIEVGRVTINYDRATNKSRGFAFVDLVNEEDLTRALRDVDGERCCGRSLAIREKKADTGGGGGGRGRSPPRGARRSGRSFSPPPRGRDRSFSPRRRGRDRSFSPPPPPRARDRSFSRRRGRDRSFSPPRRGGVRRSFSPPRHGKVRSCSRRQGKGGGSPPRGRSRSPFGRSPPPLRRRDDSRGR
eukprot:GEMP01096839.1.p1 GENE.GEMP01096839.1~~GEMP01096839.1.p1  ORF type:complete len:210 (+),score=52.32 GEMP01096839.1:130-759(+)